MRKTKIFTLLVIALLLAVSAFGVTSFAAISDSSFIASPEKSLVKGVDYEYSFAVLGDTQCISLADAKNGTAYTKQMFNWIKDNKESKNIQYVLGLGDITNTYKSSDTYYNAEWNVAKSSYAILEEAGIPYSLVRGNHDISSGMNNAFGLGSDYYASVMKLSEEFDSSERSMGGFFYEYYNESTGAFKIENSYRKLNVGEENWMIVTLDWAPSEEVLEWLGVILEENYDYKTIITLHQFLQKDGAIIDDPEGTLPHENIGSASWGEVTTGGTVHPRVLWNEVLRKHANVEMILSGHVPVDDIVRTQYMGDNGNTVTCMLIDPQDMDEALSAPLGMVAMFYFSADGEVVHVEYISTVRDTDGDASTNAYRGAKNQFSINLEYEDGWVETKYGYVPKVDYENETFLAFLDDDGDPDTESVYLGSYDRWVNDAADDGVVPMVRTQFTLGGAEIRQKKTLSVLAMKDYDAADDGKYQMLGDVCGTFKLDLNGKTFKNGKYPIFAAYARTAYKTNTFEIVNGNVNIAGAGGVAALQTSNEKGNGGAIGMRFENLNVSYVSGGTASAIVTTYAGNALYNSTSSVYVKDCSIDLYSNAPSSVTLFNLADTHENHDASVIIDGGKITIGSESAARLYTLADGDSVAFDASSGYTKLVMPASAAAPTQIHSNTDGMRVAFAKESSDGEFTTYALEKYNVPEGSLGVINVWLIAGQSNASGYAIDVPTDAATDPRFKEGFENVLYYGSADDNSVSTFLPTKIGFGKSASASGAEIGIASMLDGSGSMNAVIKLGRGSSYLYPDTSNNVSQTYGTWTSPTYMKDNGISAEGTNFGKLYNDFIQTVASGIAILEASGYTPVIRGMWWMQGEAEMWRENLAMEYEELLTALIKDVRSDLSEISGSDLSSMPFVFGIAASNKAKDEAGNYLYDQPPYDARVAEAQRSVASKVANTAYIETQDLARRDQWHFVADGQQYLGEQFVLKVNALEGKFGVTVEGDAVSMSGGGSFASGESVTVTITAADGFVIDRITYTSGSDEPIEITLDENGSYTFIMPEKNVVFTVESHDEGMVQSKYGSIPSKFADASAYPFAVFKNGEFYNAYSTWNDVLRAGASILTSASPDAILLLRRDYSTDEDSESLQDLYTMEGNLTVDLDTHTLTRGKYHLFQIMAKKTTAKTRSTNIKLINGVVETQGSTPFVINTRAGALEDHFFFEFDGVTFVYASGSTVANMVMVTYTGGSVETKVTATFKNCTFDLTNAPASFTLFNLKEASGSSKTADVTVKNSVFKASTLDGVTMFAAVGNDSFTLGENVKFRLSSSYDVANVLLSDTTGKTYSLKAAGEIEGDKLYTLHEGAYEPDSTPDGEIPEEYADANAYPFVVFDQNGKFMFAYQKWDQFLAAGSKILTSTNKKATLVVRRDYNTSENGSSSQNWYTFSGSIDIDLGENTLTIDAKSHLFQLINKCVADTVTNIKIYNGSIVTYKNYTPFVINGHTSSTANYTVNLICENVKFIYHASSTVKKLVLDTFSSGTTESNLNAEFNDCTFDMSATTGDWVIFNAKESSGTEKKATIRINGGVIKANAFVQKNVYSFASGDSISFGKGANGEYLRLVMPIGSTVPTPTEFYNADGINTYFHLYETTETEVTYVLSACKNGEKTHVCACGTVVSECEDDDKNHNCDVCDEKLSECKDENNDHNCDVCGAKLTDCKNENGDHVCDICGAKLSDCKDESGDHTCDVCGTKISECADDNNDHNCDVCGAKLSECKDENNDHNCDICGTKLSKCKNEDGNHTCDICGAKLSECGDENNDHACDVCGAKLSDCKDESDDHTCDVCGTKISECADNNNDHNCDVCGAKLTDCKNEDGDHTCDICGVKLSECGDENNDHACDVCGAKLTDCKDEDGNHTCDICGAKLSDCKDEDGDHACDACGVNLSECIDENNDHYCDTCDTKCSECNDTDNDHNCDICKQKLTECVDNSEDNACDICGKVMNEDVEGDDIDNEKNDENDTTPNDESVKTEEKPKSFFDKILEFFKNLIEKIKEIIGLKKDE